MPEKAVAYLKPSVLDGANHAVIGAGAGEGDEVAAGLEDTERLRPHFHTERHVSAVPLLAHEAGRCPRISASLSDFGWRRTIGTKPLDDAGQVIRRITHDAIDACLWQ